MHSRIVAMILGAGLLLAAAPSRANMPYPGHLCDGKEVGDACRYQSARGTCVPDPSPPQSCTGNDASGTACIWCEFDPDTEEAGCSVAGGASLGGVLALAVLVALSLARRRRQR